MNRLLICGVGVVGGVAAPLLHPRVAGQVVGGVGRHGVRARVARVAAVHVELCDGDGWRGRQGGRRDRERGGQQWGGGGQKPGMVHRLHGSLLLQPY